MQEGVVVRVPPRQPIIPPLPQQTGQPQRSLRENVIDFGYVESEIVGKELRTAKHNFRIYLVVYSLYLMSITSLVAAAGIISFITASLDPEEDPGTIRALSLTVGIIAIVVEFIHSLANGFGIQARKKSYSQGVIDLTELSHKITTRKDKFQSEGRISEYNTLDESAQRGVFKIKKRIGYCSIFY